ncbi:hypothetical protein [Maricaulis maris]|uniref:hypothetical protein n=1 Tax=Maricaulis maris TaxID=74318 RepID=UPI003B8BA9B9
MGIEYFEPGEDGLARAIITGLASRTEHAAMEERARQDIRSGRLQGIIIDASRAELPAKPSFSREIWDDFLGVLEARPFAYVPPRGHDGAERQAMIAELVGDWESHYCAVASEADGRAWCLASLAALRNA